MSVPEEMIEKEIRTLMLADSGFNELNLLMRGVHPYVPLEHYPFAEILTVDYDEASESTGLIERELYGEVRFYVRLPDTFEVTARQYDVPSYDRVLTWLDRVRHFLDANAELSDLEDQDEVPPRWQVLDLRPAGGDYGFILRDERQNTWDNYGSIEWVCRLQERRP